MTMSLSNILRPRLLSRLPLWQPLVCSLSTSFPRPNLTPAVSEDMPIARYGGRQTVALITGDGIGPEMIQHVKEVLRFSGAPVDFELVDLTKVSPEEVLQHALLAVKRNGVALKGNLEAVDGQKSKNMMMRTELGLFAYIQRCKSIPGIVTRHQNVDIFVVRENTEGEYSSLEHETVPGIVESLKVITRNKSKRIAKFAFDLAVQHNRKKVTAVHKANIMKLGDGLFLESCAEVAKLYPQIEYNNMIVDNCCMQLVSRPQQFDVMVMPNLYGNIVGNVGAGLVGGPGVTSGINQGVRCAIFESGTRNSGRSLVGKNVANPCAMLLASADMLEHIGLKWHSGIIRHSILRVMGEKAIRTLDLGGQHTTLDVVQAIIQEMKTMQMAAAAPRS